MLAAVEQMETDGLGVLRVGCAIDDDGLVGGGDVGIRWLGEVGEEDVMPESGSGGGADILNVEDVVFELFVEDTGLNLEGGLRRLQRLSEGDEAGGGAWGEIERVEEPQYEGDRRDDGDNADEVDGSHADWRAWR